MKRLQVSPVTGLKKSPFGNLYAGKARNNMPLAELSRGDSKQKLFKFFALAATFQPSQAGTALAYTKCIWLGVLVDFVERLALLATVTVENVENQSE